MKVTISCEKCGAVLLERHAVGQFLGENLDELACPACNPPQPTYGPLTVEMVAEALEIAGGPLMENLSTYEERQARFVLRLLSEADSVVALFPDNTRSWLLGLARDSGPS